MSELRPVFGEILEDYQRQMGERWEDIDLAALGVERRSGDILVPLFGRECRVSPTGIDSGRDGLLGHSMGVLLSRYLLGPYGEPGPEDASWVSFRDFPGSAPFQQGFSNTVERRIAAKRGEDPEGLRAAALELGAKEAGGEFSYDLSLVLPALPKLPLLLLFNQADEGFPASCTVLFRPDAESYLDMECIAIAGMLLASLTDPAGGW
ncbi:MAG: DUF3786 domain-containing protein [Desulfarculaceae bacterium]|nr:DUF3786 domain-containing protein [Desulfarculaceae bacterium]MCF8073585.1 DUF3786 domain-containing protein [Desulfarculaceae bacterium]MCF8103742.1 DUF3786 domain-containing protein [Desulfarculaceae bacterium]MCF8115699.1 DUF3786 domain-containing protein [Desulfarculaceae bacterium]